MKDKVICINDAVDISYPKIFREQEYTVRSIHTCKCGAVAYDIGFDWTEEHHLIHYKCGHTFYSSIPFYPSHFFIRQTKAAIACEILEIPIVEERSDALKNLEYIK